MKKRNLILCVCLIVMLFTLAGCANEPESANINLNKTEIQIIKGETFKLTLQKDGIIISDGLTWESMDASVASVEKGLVVAKKEGITSIKCIYDGKTYKANVIVLPKPQLNESSLKIEVGYTKTLTLKAGDNTITNGVEWEVIDNSVVTVQNGVVKGVAVGDTIVKAKYDNKTYVCMVEVVEAFNYVDSFTCHVTVPEMDNEVFDFEIAINSDNTFVYKRFENANYPYWEKTGSASYDSGILTLTHSSGVIKFEVIDKNTIKSVGKIITGGKDANLTFIRALEK